jgi:hypothetical protein
MSNLTGERPTSILWRRACPCPFFPLFSLEEGGAETGRLAAQSAMT